MNHKIIYELYPEVVKIVEDQAYNNDGEIVEIDIDLIKRETRLYNKQNLYKEKRKKSYPSLGDQLDMLYHELTSNGSISTNGEWYQAIMSIKETYPKPEV